MRKLSFLTVLLFLLVSSRSATAQEKPAAAVWAMKATIIEACSCPMFCQCYFNTKPASHAGHDSHGGGGEHFCRFNNAYKVNKGNYGSVKLDGAKFWVSGDLGEDFSMAQTDWAVLTFDSSVTKGQREGIATILGYVYPVKWKSFVVAKDGKIDWTASKDRAEARLDDGKTAEVLLKRFPGMTDDPIVIRNLKYFGVPRNTGFVMMPNDVEAYRVGDKKFEYKGTNGFMITIDITSKDVKK